MRRMLCKVLWTRTARAGDIRTALEGQARERR